MPRRLLYHPRLSLLEPRSVSPHHPLNSLRAGTGLIHPHDQSSQLQTQTERKMVVGGAQAEGGVW